jgi:hypothetical protein
MDGVAAAAGSQVAGVGVAVATRALQVANDQQTVALGLLDAAMEVAEQVVEAGLGASIDVRA